VGQGDATGLGVCGGVIAGVGVGEPGTPLGNDDGPLVEVGAVVPDDVALGTALALAVGTPEAPGLGVAIAGDEVAPTSGPREEPAPVQAAVESSARPRAAHQNRLAMKKSSSHVAKS
jgi:hypothetical protein